DGRSRVRLERVIPSSGAKKAGLEAGDYILSIGGQPVRHYDDVFLAVGMLLAGSTVEVERARSPDGPGEKVAVRLAKYYVPLPSIASKRPPARGGLRVDYTSLLAQRRRGGFPVIPEGGGGRRGVPGGPADRAAPRPP